jgi:hypothetical protein
MDYLNPVSVTMAPVPAPPPSEGPEPYPIVADDCKPVFLKCPLCPQRRERLKLSQQMAPGVKLCERCFCPIVAPAPRQGYESQTFDHFHLGAINAFSARMPVNEVLCENCFQKEQYILIEHLNQNQE